MVVFAAFVGVFVLGGLFAVAAMTVAGWLAIRQLARGW